MLGLISAFCLSVSAEDVLVDKTSLVANTKDAWHGTNTYGSGVEHYYGSLTEVEDKPLWQTVENLPAGRYSVEVKVSANVANWAGWAATLVEGEEVGYVYLSSDGTEKTTTLEGHNNGSKGLVSGQPFTYTIEDVAVAEGGSAEIGIIISKKVVNWFTIQCVKFTQKAGETELIAVRKSELSDKITEASAVENPSSDLTKAISSAQNLVSNPTKLADFDNAIKLLTNLIAANDKYASVAEATIDNPVETDFVTNGTFDSNIAGWTSTTGAKNNGTASNQTGAFTGKFWENWNGAAYTGKMYQYINVPNGVYKLKIAAFTSNGTPSNLFVYANEDKVNLTSDAPTAYEVLTEVKNAEIEIGLNIASGSTWCGIDNVSLTYYGNADINVLRLGSIVSAYNSTLSEANGLLSSDMDAAAKSALQKAITDNTVTVTSSTTAEELNTAKGNLETAITNANTAIAVYSKKQAASTLIAKGAGADMTSLIVNNSFEDGLTSWTQSGMGIQNNTSVEQKDGSKYAESWQPNGNRNVSQVLILPQGQYKLTVHQRTRNLVSAAAYVGGTESAFPNNDSETDVDVVFYNEDWAEVTIGAKATGNGAASSWFAVDNFRLTYVAADLPSITASTGKMNSSVAAAQTSAFATYSSEKTYANYLAAKDAKDAADASIKVYAEVETYLTKAADLDTDGKTVYNKAIETISAAYTNEELTEFTDEQKADLDAALVAAAKAQTSIPSDMTLAIANPNFDGNVKGWTDEFSGKLNHGFQNNATYGTIKQFMECWAGQWSGATAPYVLPDGKLSQVITDLPAGKYTLTADVIATQQNAGQEGYVGSHAEETGIYLFAGETKSDALSIEGSAANHSVSVEINFAGGDLEIGIMADNTNCNWMVMDNVTLKLTGVYEEPVSTPTLTYTHSVSAPDASDEETEITYVRNIASVNKWQSLCVPFSIDAASAAEQGVILAEVTMATQVGDEIVVSIAKVTTGKTTSNSPCLIAATSSYTGSFKTNSTIGAPTTTYAAYPAGNFCCLMDGNAKKGISGSYVMSGGLLRQVQNSEASLPSNHWYLTPNDPSAKVRINAIGFDDEEATGIAAAIAESMNAKSYSINGVEVNANAKGLIIKDGKKVLVK